MILGYFISNFIEFIDILNRSPLGFYWKLECVIAKNEKLIESTCWMKIRTKHACYRWLSTQNMPKIKKKINFFMYLTLNILLVVYNYPIFKKPKTISQIDEGCVRYYADTNSFKVVQRSAQRPSLRNSSPNKSVTRSTHTRKRSLDSFNDKIKDFQRGGRGWAINPRNVRDAL